MQLDLRVQTEPTELLVRMEQTEPMEAQAIRAILAIQVQLDLRVQTEPTELLVRMEQTEPMEPMEPMEAQVTPVIRVRRGLLPPLLVVQ